MVFITIVTGVYKPTNITGGHHPACNSLFTIKSHEIPLNHHKIPLKHHELTIFSMVEMPHEETHGASANHQRMAKMAGPTERSCKSNHFVCGFFGGKG
jgi:hypothetical protein